MSTGSVPPLLQVAIQICRNEFQGAQTFKGPGGGEPQAQADVRHLGAGPSNGKEIIEKKL